VYVIGVLLGFLLLHVELIAKSMALDWLKVKEPGGRMMIVFFKRAL